MNLLLWYFKETNRVLPETWPFSTFCDHLLDFQPLKELQTKWQLENATPDWLDWGINMVLI